jgi:hypothetical protein
MEIEGKKLYIVCGNCQKTSATDLKLTSSHCGGYICQECDNSSHDCSICAESQGLSQERQKTLVIQDFLSHGVSSCILEPITLPFFQIPENIITLTEDNEECLKFFDCPICFDLLFDPVTSLCGHSFCRQCLSRAIDHNPCCPVCRSPISQYSTQLSRPTDILIQYLTQILFPISYKQRKDKEQENLLELEKNLPIFVCSFTFPKIPMFLHVCSLFETTIHLFSYPTTTKLTIFNLSERSSNRVID